MSSTQTAPRYAKSILQYHIQKLQQMGLNLQEIGEKTQLQIDKFLLDDSYFHSKSAQGYRIIKLLYATSYHQQYEIKETLAVVEQPTAFNAYLLNSANAVSMLDKICQFIGACYPDNQIGWHEVGDDVEFFLKQHPLEKDFISPQGFLAYIGLMLKALLPNDKVEPLIGANCLAFPDQIGFLQHVSRNVHFGSAYSSIRIPKELAYQDIPTYNGRISAYLQEQFTSNFPQFSAPPDLLELIYADINQAITHGNDKRFFNADFIAARHGLSRATLYRRLVENHTSFTEIVNSIRKEQSQRLLANPLLSLSEISSKLGYANLSAFNRAFRRWYGIAPATLRHH